MLVLCDMCGVVGMVLMVLSGWYVVFCLGGLNWYVVVEWIFF